MLTISTILLDSQNELNAQKKYIPKQTFYFHDNVNINYEQIGHGSETIIFLHGFGLSLDSWDDIKHRFPLDKYKMFFIDLKGNGFSYKAPESDYSLIEQARIIIGFIKA